MTDVGRRVCGPGMASRSSSVAGRGRPAGSGSPPVSCRPSSVAFGVVQVRASQGRRGRDTESYLIENAARCVHGRRET